VEFRILGPVEVYDGGIRLELGARQQRALFAILLLHANEPVPLDRLVGELWGEQPPPTAAKNLHALVSRIRKSIDGRLVTRAGGYLAQVEPEELDAAQFERLLEQGRRELADGNASSAAQTLRRALALWRGPALADFRYELFAQSEIARLEELRLAATEERIEADLALARHRDVVAELERLVAAHPLRERLRGQLMVALYRCGRQAEALETYRQARRALAAELGIDPGPALKQLEAAILSHDPALGPPPATGGRRRVRRKTPLALAVGAAMMLAVLATTLALTLASGRAQLSSIEPNAVGAVDPESGAIVGQVRLGTQPIAIEAGSGGVWTAALGSRALTQIDPHSIKIAGAVALDGAVSDLAVGEGAVWTLNASGPTQFEGTPAEVSRIDSTLDDVVGTVRTGVDYLNLVEGPVAAGAGYIWAAIPENGQMPLVAIDPARARVTGRVQIAAVALATDGAGVWAISSPNFRVKTIIPESSVGLVHVDSKSLSIDASMKISGDAVAVGAGAVWLVAQATVYRNCKPRARFGFRSSCAKSLPGTLYRIDPRAATVTATAKVGRKPVAVAAADDAVWVANEDDRTLMRINPGMMRVTQTLRLGSPPTALAVGEGRVWVGTGST
jgi:DNA-binding SARP family transcriptional activator